MEISGQLLWHGTPVLLAAPTSEQELEEALASAGHSPLALILPREEEGCIESAALSRAVALFHGTPTRSEKAVAQSVLAAGGIYVSPSLAALLLLAWRRSAYRERIVKLLTERERDIMQLLAQRRSNRQIASLLYLSPHTVRNHLSRIFAKLDVTTREQAREVWLAANQTSEARRSG